MTNRVYVDIAAPGFPGLVLSLRDEIQAMDSTIEWLYDDALQILEMDGWQKWPSVEDDLTMLVIKYPDLIFTID